MKIKNFENKWEKFVSHLFPSIFHYKFISDIPYLLKRNQIYIIQDGNEPDTIVFKCPCGCKNIIHLNLLSDCSPQWSFTLKKKKISIYPSIATKRGCKSHFWVIKSKIIWVKL